MTNALGAIKRKRRELRLLFAAVMALLSLAAASFVNSLEQAWEDAR